MNLKMHNPFVLNAITRRTMWRRANLSIGNDTLFGWAYNRLTFTTKYRTIFNSPIACIDEAGEPGQRVQGPPNEGGVGMWPTASSNFHPPTNFLVL